MAQNLKGNLVMETLRPTLLYVWAGLRTVAWCIGTVLSGCGLAFVLFTGGIWLQREHDRTACGVALYASLPVFLQLAGLCVLLSLVWRVMAGHLHEVLDWWKSQ